MAGGVGVRLGWICALLGLLASAAYAFLIYPRIAQTSGAVLDPDGYGALGWGLWKYGAFSYYPNPLPSVTRGPLYPAIVALLLQFTGGAWPWPVQAAQCVFFALTCLATYALGRELWSRKAGVTCAAACALHPFLIWYTSRIWLETLVTLLFTVMALFTVRLQKRPTWRRALAAGLATGAACLCKGTFLPFIAVIPAVLWLAVPRRVPARLIAAVAAAAVLTMAPWTVRNWYLTGALIPVHGHMGFNLRVGDEFIAQAAGSPLSFTRQWEMASAEAAAIVKRNGLEGSLDWKAEQLLNAEMQRRSVQTYAADPTFLPRKILWNTLAFWAWSETPAKTAALALLQLPVAVLFFIASMAHARRRGARSVHMIPIALALVFYGAHLPVLAAARYSAVILPVVLAAVAGWYWERQPGAERHCIPAAAVAYERS